jgi:hypothetical protein
MNKPESKKNNYLPLLSFETFEKYKMSEGD